MSLARSFIKGPRFAFHHKEQFMACERCVFGTGKHTCVTSGVKSRKRSKPLAVPSVETVNEATSLSVIVKRREP